MSQPLPHAIIRWHLRHALLTAHLAATRQALAAAKTEAERAALADKLRDIERGLRALGPDPAAKMG
jgi:hypothetical protein